MKRRTKGGYWTSQAVMDFAAEVARSQYYQRLGRYTSEGARLLAMAEVFEALYSQGIDADTSDSVAADVVGQVVKIHRVNVQTAAEFERKRKGHPEAPATPYL